MRRRKAALSEESRRLSCELSSPVALHLRLDNDANSPRAHQGSSRLPASLLTKGSG